MASAGLLRQDADGWPDTALGRDPVAVRSAGRSPGRRALGPMPERADRGVGVALLREEVEVGVRVAGRRRSRCSSHLAPAAAGGEGGRGRRLRGDAHAGVVEQALEAVAGEGGSRQRPAARRETARTTSLRCTEAPPRGSLDALPPARDATHTALARARGTPRRGRPRRTSTIRPRTGSPRRGRRPSAVSASMPPSTSSGTPLGQALAQRRDPLVRAVDVRLAAPAGVHRHAQQQVEEALERVGRERRARVQREARHAAASRIALERVVHVRRGLEVDGDRVGAGRGERRRCGARAARPSGARRASRRRRAPARRARRPPAGPS